MPSPEEIVKEAARTLVQRGHDYDAPAGERSMPHAVSIFNAWSGHKLTERDGWRFMMAVKLARETRGKGKLDTYVDLAAYAGLLGEHVLTDRPVTEIVKE